MLVCGALEFLVLVWEKGKEARLPLERTYRFCYDSIFEFLVLVLENEKEGKVPLERTSRLLFCLSYELLVLGLGKGTRVQEAR